MGVQDTWACKTRGRARHVGVQDTWACKTRGRARHVGVQDTWACKTRGRARHVGVQDTWAFKTRGRARHAGVQDTRACKTRGRARHAGVQDTQACKTRGRARDVGVQDTWACKTRGRARQKLQALARLSNVTSCQQRKIIMNAFISSQFNCCPSIWMCHSRSLHTQINKIHERALRLVHKDDTSFEQLLQLSGSIQIHHRNLQLLLIEIYKALNNLSSTLMSDLFHVKDARYTLRKGNTLVSTNIKTTSYGRDSVSHLSPKIWDLIPEEIKNSTSLMNFKDKVKLRIPDRCPCKLCFGYVQNVGYILIF